MNGNRNLWIIIATAVVGVAAVGGGAAWMLRDHAGPADIPPEREELQDVSDIVELSPGKFAAAKIKAVVVGREDLSHGHTVAGRITYDETLHISVKTPADGVLTQVRVQPGERVSAGDVLAWVTSREIGTARADVMKRLADRNIAVDWLSQKQELALNVAGLAESLKKRESFSKLQKQCATQTLGEYREKMMAAYSRFLLAESMQRNIAGLDQTGAIAGKQALLQASELRTSEAALVSVCEQSILDSRRDRELARAAANDAEQRLTIARQHLNSLLMRPGMLNGTFDDASHSHNSPPQKSDREDNDLTNLSKLAIRAPISGTIESREFTAGERVKQSDSLFVLAETSRLWITADLRENEWTALNLARGHNLHVTSPAFPGQTLSAKVHRLGRTVSPESNTISLIATIKNENGKLRPGLFVRVTLPVSVESNALYIPDSAVLQQDNMSFVFVEIGERKYRRVYVKTGMTSDNRIAVLSGLKDGDRVVTEGAFLLKSELLLERDE